MIDYDKPDDDPIVAEVRKAREEFAAHFNFDLRTIFEDLREQRDNGQTYVSLPPRRPQGWNGPEKKAG